MPVRSLTEALPAGWTRGEVSVLGLARSGRAAAELLRRAGAAVYASDAGRSDAVAQAASALERLGVVVEQGGHDLRRLANSALVVASPGIPPDSVLAEIFAEHVQEIKYENCGSTTVAKNGGNNAIFVTLKPGIAFDLRNGSHVIDAEAANRATSKKP